MSTAYRLDAERTRTDLQSFIDDWRAIKDLVDECFSKSGVTMEEERAFSECKERLQRLYPSIESSVEKADMSSSGAGRTIRIGDPVQHILSTTPHISYLLQDNWTWGGLPKQQFDMVWGAGTHQLNVALGRIDFRLNSIDDIHIDDYLMLRKLVDRLAKIRQTSRRVISPLRKLAAQFGPLDSLVKAIERNPLYRLVAILVVLIPVAAVLWFLATRVF
jgi:hypothetical protein